MGNPAGFQRCRERSAPAILCCSTTFATVFYILKQNHAPAWCGKSKGFSRECRTLVLQGLASAKAKNQF